MKRRHETFLRGQGHELLQRKERDRVVPWGLHFDRANSSCMVPKTKGASRYMHLISEKHLTEELRRLNWLRRNWDQKALARDKRTQRRNRIGASPTIGWRRPCMGVTICLSIDQRELLGEHKGVEAGGRKRRGSNDESKEA
ncbi:hypothetical protein GW17_00043709 [Ensete ventricosum]|nr:hypothetical protein GW17_00043709 [Ensete ventricosum]